jgi:uncharacterized protein (DUF2236 family)
VTVTDLSGLRTRLGNDVFDLVVGPDRLDRRSDLLAPGPRWFAEDRPIRRVHGDAAMFIGGLRALLLQSLHPLAMAGVAEHSDYRADPWGRLQRTSYFLSATTYGPADLAEQAVRRVRAVHARVRGSAADGRPYSARDPHLLGWVHVAEVDSFLAAYQRYGERALDSDEADSYVADMAVIARRVGVLAPPETVRDVATVLSGYRHELTSTPAAREATRFLILHPPIPLPLRAAYAGIAAAAVGLLPIWARWPLRLPYLPVTEATVGRLVGRAAMTGLRWVTPNRLV